MRWYGNKTREQVLEATKESQLKWFKFLCKEFAKKPLSMEISSLIGQVELELHDTFGVSYETLEELECKYSGDC